MKFKLSIISILFSLTLLLISCSFDGVDNVQRMLADEDACGKKAVWRVEGSTLYIEGTGEMWNFDSSWDTPWHDVAHLVEKIEISDGITGVGDHAFDGFDSVSFISFPDSVYRIGKSAFEGVYLRSIDLPDNLKFLGDKAFFNSALKRISIPASVEYIGKGAIHFNHSPSYVYYEGTSDEWDNITIFEGVEDSYSYDGYVPSYDRYVFDESKIYYNVSSVRTKNFAPEVIEGNKCGENATWRIDGNKLIIEGSGDIWDFFDEDGVPWSEHSIREVEIGEDITGIGDYALCGTSSMIYVPKNVTYIGDEALSGSINILPEKLEYIGGQNIYLNPEIIYFGGSEDAWDNITILPDNDAVDISDIFFDVDTDLYRNLRGFDYAPKEAPKGFCGDNATWTYSDGVLTISGSGPIWDNYQEWKNLTIKNLIINDGITGIGNRTFVSCKVYNVTIPDSVEYIGDDAFSWTLLDAVKIPNGVKYIGESAFNNRYTGGSASMYRAVRSIHIPASVLHIGTGAFDSNISKISVDNNNPVYKTYGHELISKDGKSFLKYFEETQNTKSYNIPSSVKYICQDAFWYCSGLSKISIPDGVVRIGSGAFSNCQRITELKLPGSLKTIGNSAFNMCVKVKRFNIPNSVKYIGKWAFDNCRALEDIDLPSGITSILDSTFSGCESLESIKIPSGVVELESNAFSDCESLDTVRLPVSLKKIGYDAFGGSTDVDNVYYSGSEEQWGKVILDSGNEFISEVLICNG